MFLPKGDAQVKKFALISFFIALCLSVSSVCASGVDDDFIQNIVIEYAHHVGSLKKEDAAVILDTIDYPHKEIGPNLSMVTCNEGVVSIGFVKQVGNEDPIQFLGELSYTSDGLIILVSGLKYGYPSKYSMAIGFQDHNYDCLEDLVAAYNDAFGSSLEVPVINNLHQIWDIPLGMDFEEAGHLLAERLDASLEQKVDERSVPIENLLNNGNPYFEVDGILLRNQQFKVDLYSANDERGLYFNQLSITDEILERDNADYALMAMIKFEILMQMMTDRFGKFERNILRVEDRFFDAALDSDGKINKPVLSKLNHDYQMTLSWKNICLQLDVQQNIGAFVSLSEKDIEDDSFPTSEGIFDEKKLGVRSF